MRGFYIIQTPQNLGGVVFLLVFVAVISQATGEETTNECDSDNTCWYLQPGKTTVSKRSWTCLWLWKCKAYTVSTEPEQVCHCCPGWQGDATDCQRCPEGHFGYNCKGECECTDNETTQCDPRNGVCYRPDEIVHNSCIGLNCTNAQMCNHENNTCDCPSMWRGDKCNVHSSCSDGLYGAMCDRKCQCNNQTSHCDVLTGECMCYIGWMGPACNETCPQWFHGENCSMECDCPRNASECDPVSGDCLCPAGFYGTSCSSECPDGRFGPSCLSPCTCDNSTGTCNRINGTCTDDPEVYAGDDGVDPLPNSSAGPVVGAIVASALLVALFVIIILFLIRRSKQAKQTRDTLVVKKTSGKTANPCYDNPIDFVGDTSNSHMTLQHFVVGGATYAMSDNATGVSSSSCNAEAMTGFEDSYSHIQPTTGDCISPHQYGGQTEYSHLTRDDRMLLASRPADSSEEARYAATTPVPQSKAKEYDNLSRGVKQSGGVTKYEVVILNNASSTIEKKTLEN